VAIYYLDSFAIITSSFEFQSHITTNIVGNIVGNGSLMAALDAGCARTLWPQRHTYALVKGCASSENVFTPLVFLSFSPFLA